MVGSEVGATTTFELLEPTCSCLPRTMGVARKYRRRVSSALGNLEVGVPFDDRVLVWLAPTWISPVRAFHDRSGEGMRSMLSESELTGLDHELYRELKKRLGIVPARRRQALYWILEPHGIT
jgi:hypothetical protein